MCSLGYSTAGDEGDLASLEDVNRQADRFVASLPQAQREFFDFDTFFDEQLAPFPNG
jgi:hypothetical protein